jgi:hypothetical protein
MSNRIKKVSYDDIDFATWAIDTFAFWIFLEIRRRRISDAIYM